MIKKNLGTIILWVFLVAIVATSYYLGVRVLLLWLGMIFFFIGSISVLNKKFEAKLMHAMGGAPVDRKNRWYVYSHYVQNARMTYLGLILLILYFLSSS